MINECQSSKNVLLTQRRYRMSSFISWWRTEYIEKAILNCTCRGAKKHSHVLFVPTWHRHPIQKLRKVLGVDKEKRAVWVADLGSAKTGWELVLGDKETVKQEKE